MFEPTKDQNRVIQHTPSKHGRVLAGPGTGKSSTAVALAVELAQQTPRPRVKFLTFTRAATAELAKKVRDAGQESTDPSTLHSFSISVLLKNPGTAPIPQPLRISDDWEVRNLLRPHLSGLLGVGVGDIDRLLREMASKWESLNPNLEEPEIVPSVRNRFIGTLNLHRRVFGYTLLSELPDLLRGVLRDYEDLEGIEYDLLIVDEYQDLNACDLDVLRRLSERGTKILAIGDDDQSIYSFRKADPEGIRRFHADYPEAEDYSLTFCHRLNVSIGEWAQFVIDGDTGRAPRPPLSYSKSAPQGLVSLVGFRSEVAEASGVASLVEWLVEDEGIEPSDIIILFRSDWQSRFSKKVREAIGKLGIDIVDTQKSQALLAEPEARRMLAVLQLIRNPRDSLAWWTMAHLTGGLGRRTIDEIYGLAVERGVTFGDVVVAEAPDFLACSPKLRARLSQLWSESARLIDELAPHVPEESDEWGGLIARWCGEGRLPQCSDELLRLVSMADEPGTIVPFEEFVTRFGLRLQEQAEADQTGVRLMTMSSSKGLTAEACIVVGVEDSLIPWRSADINEERRLLYVAMTRARRHLVLTWVEWRRGAAAHSGTATSGRRRPTDLLRGGPVESVRAETFLAGD